MVHSKTDLFPEELQQKAEYFKALGHPARLAILRYLAQTKMCITGDISESLPLGRTTVNQHLLELKKAGFIQGIIQGSRTRYCLNPDKIDDLKNISSEFFTEISEYEDPYC